MPRRAIRDMAPSKLYDQLCDNFSSSKSHVAKLKRSSKKNNDTILRVNEYKMRRVKGNNEAGDWAVG